MFVNSTPWLSNSSGVEEIWTEGARGGSVFPVGNPANFYVPQAQMFPPPPLPTNPLSGSPFVSQDVGYGAQQQQHGPQWQQMSHGLWAPTNMTGPGNVSGVQMPTASAPCSNLGYRDPQLNPFAEERLLEQARVEQDELARFELYHRSEEIIVDDAPWVPLWHSNGGYVLVKPNVEDYFMFPLIIPKYRYIYFTE